MTTRSRLIGLTIVVLLVFWAMASGGQFEIFIDIPSVLLIVGIVAGGLWACFGPATVLGAFRRGLFDKGDPDPMHVAVMARGYQLAWGAGIVGTFVGLVIMLQNMDDPSKIGPGMAVSLLTMLYGAFVAELVFGVLHQSLMNQQQPDAEPGSAGRLPQSMLAKGAAAVFAALLMFMVLLAALPNSNEDPFAEVIAALESRLETLQIDQQTQFE